jgi:hypothetical protein
MAKVILKSLKVCKHCCEGRAKASPKTPTTGLVNKKRVSGFVCLGYVGEMICDWEPMEKV